MARRTKADKAWDELVESMGEPVDVTLPPPPEGDAQDVVDRGALALPFRIDGTDLVRTAQGAVKWAWGEVKENDDQYEGLCLRFVRSCFNVDALWPSAIVNWTEAPRKWRTSDPMDVPRGHAVHWRIGEFGHIALGVGDGKCISTDIRDPGQANLCRIDRIGEAWGAQLLGYVKVVNGEEAPRMVEGRRTTEREWRIRHVRNALSHARMNGQDQRAKHLRAWLDHLLGR